MVSGAEAFADFIRDGDSATGPYVGEVKHGYENGKEEDWVELTPNNGTTVRIPVFSDRIFRNPENYPLVSFLFAGVPTTAVDPTGIFTNLSGLNKYLWAGAGSSTAPQPPLPWPHPYKFQEIQNSFPPKQPRDLLA